ncbi:Fusicoccadiene synthase [Penicillium canescens]|nr:Fusicoccadiene synthase [Penicillium canescens]KAJ6165670.1 Fusicoccadiene synthase [Penicillium canescens]
MEYRYSSIVDPSTYETEGLCSGISVCVHQNQDTEDLGCIRAREDWRTYVAPLGFYKGSLGPRFNLLSVAFPETPPERLEILAYLTEYIFLHDDAVETVDQAKGDKQNDEARDVFREGAKKKEFKTRGATGRKLMMGKVTEKILAIDPGPGSAALDLWVEWFDKGAGRRNHSQFDTLDEYLEYRILDVGKMYLTGVATFAMGLNIPEHELELRSQICRPAWVVIGLTNDLFSFNKELEAANDMGADHKIRENVAEYIEAAQQTKNRADLSRDLRSFVEAVQYVMSGNLVWTLDAPRYNPNVTYNGRQLDWMANGSPGNRVLA